MDQDQAGAAGGNLRDRLRGALPEAMKARDAVAVAALRSALAAIDNAEAADRRAAARDYEHRGRREHAERLRGEAEVLGRYLSGRP